MNNAQAALIAASNLVVDDVEEILGYADSFVAWLDKRQPDAAPPLLMSGPAGGPVACGVHHRGNTCMLERSHGGTHRSENGSRWL